MRTNIRGKNVLKKLKKKEKNFYILEIDVRFYSYYHKLSSLPPPSPFKEKNVREKSSVFDESSSCCNTLNVSLEESTSVFNGNWKTFVIAHYPSSSHSRE